MSEINESMITELDMAGIIYEKECTIFLLKRKIMQMQNDLNVLTNSLEKKGQEKKIDKPAPK